jgi:hypothetical protein
LGCMCTELSAQDFRDSLLFVRYARFPPDLPSHLDGCHQKFNEIRDELNDLTSKALPLSAVREEPKTHTSRTSESKSDEEKKETSVKKRLFRNNRNRGDMRRHFDSRPSGAWWHSRLLHYRRSYYGSRRCQVEPVQSPRQSASSS